MLGAGVTDTIPSTITGATWTCAPPAARPVERHRERQHLDHRRPARRRHRHLHRDRHVSPARSEPSTTPPPSRRRPGPPTRTVEQHGDRHRHPDPGGRPVDRQDRRRDHRRTGFLGHVHDRGVNPTGPSAVIGAAVVDSFPAELTAPLDLRGAGGGPVVRRRAAVTSTPRSICSSAPRRPSPSPAPCLHRHRRARQHRHRLGPRRVRPRRHRQLRPTSTPSRRRPICRSPRPTARRTPSRATRSRTRSSSPTPDRRPSPTPRSPTPSRRTCWAPAGPVRRAGGSSCPASGSGSIDELVTLAPSGSATFTLTATVASTATGSLANTADVDMPIGTTDPTPGNNTATDTDTLTPQVDLAVTKTNAGRRSIAGSATSYTVEVTNNGPSAVTGATVADVAPSELESVTWTCSATVGSSCPTSGTGDINDPVDLAVGGRPPSRSTQPCPPTPRATSSNTATVTVPSGVADPTPAQQRGDRHRRDHVRHDLAITKNDGATTEVPGTAIQYTIVVSNPTGPSDAVNAEVADTLPATLTSATWTCVAAGGGVVRRSLRLGRHPHHGRSAGRRHRDVRRRRHHRRDGDRIARQHGHRHARCRVDRPDARRQHVDRHRHADPRSRPADHQDGRPDRGRAG